jgi:DNA excision repair protein ERCC-2
VPSDPKPLFTVSVKDLVEFVLQTGDLAGDRRFVGSGRALQGIRGHQKIQRSRPPGYETEIPIQHELDAGTFLLRLRGRIDGLATEAGQVIVEEIKTIHGRWDGAPDPLHWAQAKIYAYIYALKKSLSTVIVQLTYLELETGKISEFRQTSPVPELARFFTATAEIYLEWMREEVRWATQRDESLKALAFPFAKYRPGQREMAVMTYKILAQGGRGFIAAPTGIGKTISALFPAVKALGEGRLRRIYYLTARTVGRIVAEKAVADLRKNGLRLRTVTLTAKDKVCTRDGQPCDPRTCPLAIGYYDRRQPAMREALQGGEITREALEAIGKKHQVCPFELSLDVSLWSDAVICDYNYVFDPKACLQRHFAEEGEDFGFLVDEAHNLPDRAREMFSGELDTQPLRAISRDIKPVLPKCARALTNLHRAIQQLSEPVENADGATAEEISGELELFAGKKPQKSESLSAATGVRKEFPEHLLPLLEAALDEMESWLARNEVSDFREDLLALYFQTLSFKRTAELYDDRFVTLVTGGNSARMRLLCLDPSHLLRQALNRGKSAIFFSATLTPIDYYRSLSGGEPGDLFLELTSPFPPGQLAVFIHDRIQTRFKARANSLEAVAAAVGALVQAKPGNYLVYFPSYQYLSDVLEKFRTAFPHIRILEQHPGMSETERSDFLAAFQVEHQTVLVGFAVLGGIFGEGIDLVGERLIGAIIVGVGLSQLSLERNLIRDHFEEKLGAGFDYAYTFPGMNRVLQATGRVIRSETDKGVVLLIDARFGQSGYGRLFPEWWKPVQISDLDKLNQAAKVFWMTDQVVS